MISLYSTWWIKPGEQEALQPALKTLTKNIQENEEGTLMYLVHTPNYDFPEVEKGKNPIVSDPMVRPGTLIFVEKYASWDAFKEHLYGPYFTGFVEEYKSKFVLGDDGNPFVQVVFMDEETGFVR
ncbi:MAG: antibiotic biosynthesis monooxygenase [Flavobacteriaceae bacterium]